MTNYEKIKAMSVEEMAELFSVYVEVVHEKWIRPTKISGRNFDIPHCSACHEVPCGAEGNYCPNCGAKMDGGAD